MEVSPYTGDERIVETSISEAQVSSEEAMMPPHEALFFVLAYLPVFELLSISRVCRSLRDAVNSDELVWRNIIVGKPLNSRICNNLLMKIASKSSGKLRTLVLINCGMITDEGLQRVVEQNPLINRLYLPACTGLSPGGVIEAVRTLTKHQKTLEALQLSGIYNIRKDHIEALQSCLHHKAHNTQQPALFRNKPINFLAQNASVSSPPIEVEICPRCDEVRMVFDCPRESCRRRQEQWAINCRGCYFCIPRCEECGGCTGDDPGEAACEDVLCTECWLQLPKCSFCNKPYCKQHANRGHRENSQSSTGFVCDACHTLHNPLFLALEDKLEVGANC